MSGAERKEEESEKGRDGSKEGVGREGKRKRVLQHRISTADTLFMVSMIPSAN